MTGAMGQASALSLDLRYYPRPLQLFVHQNFKRFNYLVVHRRFGKSKLAIAQILTMALQNPLPNPRYLYIAPTYKQAKLIAWEDLKNMVKGWPFVETNEQDLRMTIHRKDRGDKITINLFSADNYESILGIYADGAVFDEWQNCNPIVYSRIVRPLLADRQGWAMFLGTPRGEGHFKDMYEQALLNPEWFTFLCGNKTSKIIPESEMASLTVGMSKEEIEQEFECSFVAPNSGAYYASAISELRNKIPPQVTYVPHDPSALVHTAWDLGLNDAMAIWFYQNIGNAVHVIDFEIDSGQDLPFYVRKMREGDRAKYTYDETILPHDAKVRSLESGKTRVQILNGLGLTRVRVLDRLPIEDGIYAVRSILPRCWFDQAKCFEGLKALESYKKQWDEKRQTFASAPLHDWSSNAADAFRYLALGSRNPSRRSQNTDLPREAEGVYSVFDPGG